MRRMDDAKAEKLMELFLGGVPLRNIAEKIGMTVNAISLKITQLRKAGYDLPRRDTAPRRRSNSRDMTYLSSVCKPKVAVDWAMRPCLGPLCLGKRFNSSGPFSRLCPGCKHSNKLICDRIEA